MGTWKDLEISEEEALLQRIEIDNRFAELSCQIFLQSPGKEFLQLLKETFLEEQVANPEENAAVAYYREGQNSLIRRIIQSLAQYKSESNEPNKADKIPVETTGNSN